MMILSKKNGILIVVKKSRDKYFSVAFISSNHKLPERHIKLKISVKREKCTYHWDYRLLGFSSNRLISQLFRKRQQAWAIF